nr:MAG TPA: Protein of unknown function (DUF1218) [Caudoviricetes sp.]
MAFSYKEVLCLLISLVFTWLSFLLAVFYLISS